MGDVDSDESSCSGSSSSDGSREGSPTLGDKVHCDLNESQSSQTTPSDGERRVYDEQEQDSEGRRRKRKFSASSPSPLKQVDYLSTGVMNDDDIRSSSASSSSSHRPVQRQTNKKTTSNRKSGRGAASTRGQPIMPPPSLPLQQQPQQQAPLKKRKINEANIVYPFFGINQPSAPKIVALRCLEYLDGPSLYNMSVVNTLWSKAAMDDALWE